VSLLVAAGAEVIEHDQPLPGLADAMYVHDPVLICDRGAILMRMGKV
jgi:dimethylargininase